MGQMMLAWSKKQILVSVSVALKACRYIYYIHYSALRVWRIVSIRLFIYFRQAVMASDFSIAQFCFLERLLIVHGHWCYKRIATMVMVLFWLDEFFSWIGLVFVSYESLLCRSATFSTRTLSLDWHFSITKLTQIILARLCIMIGFWRFSTYCLLPYLSVRWEFLSRIFQQNCALRYCFSSLPIYDWISWYFVLLHSSFLPPDGLRCCYKYLDCVLFIIRHSIIWDIYLKYAVSEYLPARPQEHVLYMDTDLCLDG